MSIREALAKLVLGQDLSRAEAQAAMRSLVEGEATPSQIAGFAVALRMKGETPEEIAGLAEVMRDAATRVDAGPNVVDVVGTGGDGAGTFNISTVSALLVANQPPAHRPPLRNSHLHPRRQQRRRLQSRKHRPRSCHRRAVKSVLLQR